jgi:hypothetical protein
MSTPQPKYRLVIEEIIPAEGDGRYPSTIELVSIRLADANIDAIVACALGLPPPIARGMRPIKSELRDCDPSMTNPLGQCPHRNG